MQKITQANEWGRGNDSKNSVKPLH